MDRKYSTLHDFHIFNLLCDSQILHHARPFILRRRELSREATCWLCANAHIRASLGIDDSMRQWARDFLLFVFFISTVLQELMYRQKGKQTR